MDECFERLTGFQLAPHWMDPHIRSVSEQLGTGVTIQRLILSKQCVREPSSFELPRAGSMQQVRLLALRQRMNSMPYPILGRCL